MILRITYCTVVLLLCIGLGLLIEAPGHLIAETEPDRIQADENSEELLLRSIVLNTFKEKKQNLSRLTSQQILNNALQRELSSNERFQQAPTLQILPATVLHRSRKKSLTKTSLQKKPRRKSRPRSRNSGVLVVSSTPTPKDSEQNSQLDQPDLPDAKDEQSQPLPALPKPEVLTETQFNDPPGRVVLSGANSRSAATIPVGFLNSPKPNSADAGRKSSLSRFKRAIKGLNRRSEPQTGANKRSQSSAPRRFIPTNPKPVSQDETSIRQTGESASQGKIVQAQQNSAISRELEKLYRKDGRQMPQMRTPNRPGVPQGTATNHGFAPSRIAPGNGSGNRQSANTQKKPPIWKRLFSIGRKKQPQQNQQPQYNQPPQFSQQPQYNQQPSLEQLPRIPSSTPNYGSRNKPGDPGLQNPAAFPFGRQNPTNISRTPRPFPGTRSRNSEQNQSFFSENRRINGDAPQFDSFSDQFDPFAIPQEIQDPRDSSLNSADAQSQKYSDPFSDDFNPFEVPEESVDSQSQSAQPPQPSTTNPFSEDFDPFSGLEKNEDSENATQDKKSESADTTQAQQKSAAKPTERETNPFQQPKQLQQDNPAPVPPVSEANEQSRGGNSSGDSLENAFPDLSETEADLNNPDENPFTGFKLSDEPENLNNSLTVPAPQKTTQTTENSQTDPIKITPADAPKPLETETNKNSESSPNSEVSEKSELSQTQRKKADQKEKREKLIQIFERVGLNGFKGFCPVTLRDQRELINSKLKFKAIYESRIYFFSTENARDKFENDPEHYAPVDGGKDIVMLRDDEEKVQGSLDHAVWFMDRLYLFSSADSLKTFIKTPKKYSEDSSENESADDEEEAKDSDDSDETDGVSVLFSEDEED